MITRWILLFGQRLVMAMMTFIGICIGSQAIAQQLIPMRIGWQPTTPVEAQIAHVLQKTDILERNGLKGQFTMFTFGPAVNEALVSGAIDVGFIGDMPSVSLAAVNAPIKIIGRQSVFRGAIVSSKKSNIENFKDLKGKKIHGPFGSSIYLATLGMVNKAGLKPGSDVSLVNMGFADLSDALRAGVIDSAFVWDPWVENFVEKGFVRVIDEDTDLTMVIAMRDEYKNAHPGVVEKFLRAHKEAQLFAAANHELVNKWFQEPELARQLSLPVIQKTAAYDPQWVAKTTQDIRVSFNDVELKRYLDIAKKAHELKIYPTEPGLQNKLDLAAAKKLDATAWVFDPKSVKLKQ